MILALALLLLASPAQPSFEPTGLWLGRSAELALACVHKEYPNKIAHVLNGDADVRAPRELTPAFYGCYDWHSSVHGHWLLARVARLHPDAAFAARARAALDKSLTAANIAAEVRYLNGAGRVSFERPYGLAWLLQLHTELHEWAAERPADGDVRKWAETLEPLTSAAIARIADWLPKLTAPIRVGEHSQTAFSFGLMLDWARATSEKKLESLLLSRSRDFYLNDRGCPIAYEPSGEDFLSPCVAEADLMRRVLPEAEFTRWLRDFLPSLPTNGRRRMARARRGDRPHRSQAWASLRTEPLEGVDAPGHCAKPPGVRSARRGAHGRRADSQHRGHDRRHGGALRRWPLAGHIRRIPRIRPWSAGSRRETVAKPVAA